MTGGWGRQRQLANEYTRPKVDIFFDARVVYAVLCRQDSQV
jgi:hypothetical protein